MIFSVFSCIFCNYIVFNWIILPLAITFGVKIYIKKSRGTIDLSNEIDISGKTVIITGASDGIGKVTAEELAARGAKVIMACRNPKKAQIAHDDIRKRTKNGELIVMQLDLSSLASIRKFASEYISKYGGPSNKGLSILINNAGITNTPGVRKETGDGFEEVFGVNHLGHFLLTNVLLPEIERAGECYKDAARIIIVSSMGHNSGSLNFDDLMLKKTPLIDFKFMGMTKFYTNSKLANNLFNLELAKRFRAKGLNVNSYALCPGFVDTNISTERELEHPIHPVMKYIVFPFLAFFLRKDATEGAETTLYCALSKYVEHHSGEMYRDNQFWDYSQRIKLSEKDAALLWEKSAELVKL